MFGERPRLDDYFRRCLAGALESLDRVEPDILLSENADVLMHMLLQQHMPTPISVEWGGITRSEVIETTTQRRDDFRHDRVYTVPASSVTLTVPIQGTSEMLNYQASHFTLGGNHDEIARGAVVITVVSAKLGAEVIQGEISAVRNDVDRRSAWANEDLSKFLAAAESEVRNKLSRRRERILNDRAVEEALGIPIRTTSTPQPPVAARRKHIALETRQAAAKFVPEPVLAEAIYQDVLAAVQSWADQMERTPRTTAKLDEEELRDLLLGNLNTYWQGAAGGELFNGSGKTDILIREGNRNAFIGECKIWRGPKGAAEAVDQLLSYLVWRDSKAALIMFVKTTDPVATIEKLQLAVEEHPSYVMTRHVTNPERRSEYIVTADDEGRRVSLAVIPVIIRPA